MNLIFDMETPDVKTMAERSKEEEIMEYGVYEQGAIFTREDFDPFKTILYVMGLSERKFKQNVIERLKKREEKKKDVRYLIKAFVIKPEKRNLKLICDELLTTCELEVLAANNVLENEMVYMN